MYPGRILYRILFLLTCLAHWPQASHSQILSPTQFSTREGLPSSEVYDVFIDPQGLVWLTTDRGICSYDGYDFHTYGLQDGLSSSTNLRIFPGWKNQLWFSGLDGSLTVLENGKFRPFALNQDLKQRLKGSDWVERAGMDTAGTLFMTLPSHGERPCYFKKSTDQELQLANWDSLAQIPEAWQHRSLTLIELMHSFIGNYEVPSVVKVPGENYLYLAGPSRDTLYRLEKGIRESSHWTTVEQNILDLLVDREGDLWVGTVDGLLSFPRGDLKESPKRYLPGMSISSLAQDQEGNFWLTTLAHGVLLVPSFDFERFSLAGVPDESITLLLPMEDHLIIGTLGGKIMGLDRNKEVEQLVYTPDQFGNYSYGSVRGNRAWVVGHSFVEGPDGLQVNLRLPVYQSFLQNLELTSGELILSGHRGYQIRGLDFSLKYDSGKEFERRVQCSLESQSGIWLGTLEGLFRSRGNNYRQMDFLGEQYPALKTRINDLTEDLQGNVWAATIGNGLVMVGEQEVVQLGTAEGLNSNMVNAVFLQDDSTLLAGSNLGLNMVRFAYRGGKLQVKAVENLSQRYGVPGHFVRDVAYWQGEVWLATNEGLLRFDPHALPTDPQHVPEILLNQVLVNHEPLELSKQPSLEHNANDLVFHFVGISHRKPADKPFYRFRLVENGEPGPWNFTNDRSVQYFNLLPGHYLFEAMARNREDVWSPHPIQFPFVIQAHYSDTVWFRNALVVLLLMGAVGILLWYRRRIRRKAAEERRLQAFQLKVQAAEITALRNQINPHFVFNVLNSIQNFYFKNDPVLASRYLSKFSRLMRDGLQYSGQQLIALEAELEFIQTYLELEQMRFPDKFTFDLRIDPEIDLKRHRLPPFLFQPVLENAVKHAFKNIDYPGQLLLDIDLVEDRFQIVISDNGPGLQIPDPQKAGRKLHQSLGLKLVREQIQLLNAARGYKAATFRLVDLKMESPDQHGVKAVFSIPIQLEVPV